MRRGSVIISHLGVGFSTSPKRCPMYFPYLGKDLLLILFIKRARVRFGRQWLPMGVDRLRMGFGRHDGNSVVSLHVTVLTSQLQVYS
jgi:hypothetical protein